MYCYLLYLIGYYTYEETKEQASLNNERAPEFPDDKVIIKNREIIIDKNQLMSNYKNVVDELKKKIEKQHLLFP